MAKLYAGETAETILERILTRVAAKFDKRLGSIIYDATAPASIEFEALYAALDYILDQSFADTAERPYLIRRAAERGVVPKPASYAKVTGVFTPADVVIPQGARFNCGEFVYWVSEQIAPGRYYLYCETAGSAPNGQTGRLIPVQTIPGLKTAELVEVSTTGDDEEDTEVFRARYYDSLTADQYGGNVADYKAKIRSIPGVGGVKVFPAWNGGGTVRCVILNSDLNVPSVDFVEEVQNIIDPLIVNGEVTQGQGLGVAPIGHYVTITGATAETIDIQTRLSFRSGYSLAGAIPEIEAALDAYYRDINGDWQNQENVVVRVSEITARLLSVTGVSDVQNTLLNGSPANVVIDTDSMPQRGEFVAV